MRRLFLEMCSGESDKENGWVRDPFVEKTSSVKTSSDHYELRRF